MSTSISYECDACHTIMTSIPSRGGSLSGKDVIYLTGGYPAFHACSDACLITVLEGWIQKIKLHNPTVTRALPKESPVTGTDDTSPGTRPTQTPGTRRPDDPRPKRS